MPGCFLFNRCLYTLITLPHTYRPDEQHSSAILSCATHEDLYQTIFEIGRDHRGHTLTRAMSMPEDRLPWREHRQGDLSSSTAAYRSTSGRKMKY